VSDVAGTAYRHDGTALSGKISATALSKRLERDLVADPLDQHDRLWSLSAASPRLDGCQVESLLVVHLPSLASFMVRLARRLAPSATAREDRSGTAWRLAMALRLICMCGYVIEGDDDDELWTNAQGHMGVLHPELVGNVTREDLLAQAELV
jgi:hypothetical protein